MRIALGIEYDGTPFCGWQMQKGSPSVQEAVERALSTVADHPVTVICAGRTDTGVHGIGQVVHFDTAAERSMRSWVFGANANLPKSVAVQWAQPIADHFHARFRAVRRRYRYVIFSRPVRPTFLAYRVTWDYRPLDARRMHQAGQSLVGEHDFSSYRALGCQAKHPLRTIHELSVRRDGAFVIMDVEADGFLHHMVRNIVGVLSAIGAGEQPLEWAAQVLELRDRTRGGVTAPPHGLYFARVTYPAEYRIPEPSSLALPW